MSDARLIPGGLAVDDRGSLSFVNDFDFAGVRRFYVVANHSVGFIRAWHGHRREAKYITMLQGAAIVAVVKIADWENPPSDSPVQRFVLSAAQPAVLYIPAGHANGFKTLTADTKVVVFSTATLEESRGDDIRYPADHFGPGVWTVVER
jgi:dTDP-4-dehydrorhamnose 3,5-epimerase-like enzyme